MHSPRSKFGGFRTLKLCRTKRSRLIYTAVTFWKPTAESGFTVASLYKIFDTLDLKTRRFNPQLHLLRPKTMSVN